MALVASSTTYLYFLCCWLFGRFLVKCTSLVIFNAAYIYTWKHHTNFIPSRGWGWIWSKQLRADPKSGDPKTELAAKISSACHEQGVIRELCCMYGQMLFIVPILLCKYYIGGQRGHSWPLLKQQCKKVKSTSAIDGANGAFTFSHTVSLR